MPEEARSPGVLWINEALGVISFGGALSFIRNYKGHPMDFIIVANDWSAGIDNPTSKHRIAIELANRANRVYGEGAGMRAPALGSGRIASGFSKS